MNSHQPNAAGDFDIVIVGAGVAGLAAAQLLSHTGLKVAMLEARDRVGGRILTEHTPEGWAVELGAEFIHGRPRQIFDRLKQTGLHAREIRGSFWHVQDGYWSSDPELLSEEEHILGKIKVEDDTSIAEYFNHRRPPIAGELKSSLLGYINGFHAADPARVSAQALAEGTRAQKAIGGDQNSRVVEGYSALVRNLANSLHASCKVFLSTPVRAVDWNEGHVEVIAGNGEDSATKKFQSSCALVTLPLSLLQQSVLLSSSGSPSAVHFHPAITQKHAALNLLEMGPAVRISFCFKERFWTSTHPPGVGGKVLNDLCFIFSQEKIFPTWWTKSPAPEPIITGWAGGAYAAALAGQTSDSICEQALETLSHLFSMEKSRLRSQLQSFHMHDWQQDPYSRGAYSYALVGGANAFRELAKPIAQTLFFGGEATDFTGHNATVHGALASGERAAAEMLSAMGQRRRIPPRQTA